MSKMKKIIEKSISKQGSPCVSVPQSPNPHKEEIFLHNRAIKMNFRKIRTKKSWIPKCQKTTQLGKRSVDGEKKRTKTEMKKLRAQQTTKIAKILDAVTHHLPKI